MTDKLPSSIVRTTYRRKRPPKRKTPVAILTRIVTAKQPKPTGPIIDDAVVTPRRAAAQVAAIIGPRIVTAPRKPSRFGPVQDLGAEEHQRRGDAAVALFKEIVRRVTGDGGT
jgi:hypothetical protein